MSDIRETVAEQLKKWHALDQLLADEEIYSFLQKHFSSNGHVASRAFDFAAAENKHAAQPEPRNQNEPRRRGDFMAAVTSVCRELSAQTAFTAWDVERKMKESGFRFNSADPTVAVGQVLRKLAERNAVVRVLRPGSGRRPTRYQRLPE